MADVAILVVHAGSGNFEAGMNVHDDYPGGTSASETQLNVSDRHRHHRHALAHSRWCTGTRTHLILAKRLGMSRVIVVVNGMDNYAANYSPRRYHVCPLFLILLL